MAKTITKNRTATILTKTGRDYSYTYNDLASINKWLEENELDYYQEIETNPINGKDYVLTYRYINGEWEDKPKRGCQVVDASLLGVSNPAQENGSALSFARRYSLCLAFGLASEDNDAQGLSKPIEVTEEYAKNYVFGFGKNKGLKLTEVIEKQPKYIDWLLKNEDTSEDLLKSIEILTGEKPKEIDLDKTRRLMQVIVAKDLDTDAILEYYKVKDLNELTSEQVDEIIRKRG